MFKYNKVEIGSIITVCFFLDSIIITAAIAGIGRDDDNKCLNDKGLFTDCPELIRIPVLSNCSVYV